MEPVFFDDPGEFHEWLRKHHGKENELILGFYKVSAKKKGITYPEALDEALAFGWIDGIRKNRDAESYTIRFTPRKTSSIWSNINIKKVEELIKQGRMQAAGLEAYEKKTDNRSGVYAFENKDKARLSPEFEKKFKSEKSAWKFFESQPNSYRYTAAHWVMSAKREETRLSRLETLIRDSENETRIKPLRPGGK